MKENLEFERNLEFGRNGYKVIGNDGGAIGIKGVENKALNK
ncbi:hypothetical protein [Helicobacter pylori]|nr:hypothetical protein [Helicobacter pylori]EKE87430.1 hypothetical protein OUG_0252 [Helicobacter pylori R32b]